MPKFSIITPVYVYNPWRLKMLHRAVESVKKQTVKDWEHIVIDDGSKIPVPDNLATKVLKEPHLERIRAYNYGLKEAKGKWICFLDSDDEYVSYYLEAVEKMIEKCPKAKMFNFGSIHLRENYYAKTRDAFKPKKLRKGHEIFGGGTIVNGTFVFHRSVYTKCGAFPTTSSPWDFSTTAQEEFPELKEMFMIDKVNEPNKIAKELGNPFGNDFYIFYKFTRKFHSIPFDCHLYIVHPSRKVHKL
jgi:glycosyltransferase involved in cell wall biosynthesis